VESTRLTELLHSTTYPLTRDIIAKHARRTTSVHGPLHRRWHELAVNPNTRREVHGPVYVVDEPGAFLQFLTHVRDGIRDIEHVKVYDARCESHCGALVPHGVHDAADRLQVRLRCVAERGAQLRGRCSL
jgi:hypothetical protein